MSAALLEELDPMLLSIAAEFGRRHRVHGAEADDFLQELRIWVLENAEKVGEWLDPDLYEPKHGTKMLAAALRNQCKDYGVDIKAQALGYERADLYFYGKGEVKALLASVFDPDKWHEPPQSEGRSTKSAAEGGGWIATLADVARAVKALSKYDRDLLTGFHKDGWTNKMMADAEQVSESLMSYYHDRAIGRLLKELGGSSPRPMRPQVNRDPWRGRRAIGNAHARAITGGDYE